MLDYRLMLLMNNGLMKKKLTGKSSTVVWDLQAQLRTYIRNKFQYVPTFILHKILRWHTPAGK